VSDTITLKISKKMAALLTAINPDGGTVALVAAEVAAGRTDKDGAVQVEAERDNAFALLGFALGSMSKLDAALALAEGDDKRRMLGEHSAWRALVKQLPRPEDARP
jgi:hypothetical protein